MQFKGPCREKQASGKADGMGDSSGGGICRLFDGVRVDDVGGYYVDV